MKGSACISYWTQTFLKWPNNFFWKEICSKLVNERFWRRFQTEVIFWNMSWEETCK